MPYTAYLFDFDYTLADSSRGITLCFRHVLERNGYAGVTDEAIRRTIGKTLEESFSILTGVTDPDRLAAFKAEYRREADVYMTPNTRLFPETLRVLRTLKERGAKIGIISTKYRFRIHDTMDQHLPADFLDIVVGGEDVSRAKPDPEGLLYAIRQLGVKKKRVLYIGDSTVDAETAQAAGVDFAGVTHGVTTADELAAYPHRRIMDSLTELLAPRRIAVRQIILLFFLLWFGWAESIPPDDDPTFFFFTLFLVYLLKVGSTRRLLPREVKAWLCEKCHPLIVRARAFHIRQIRGKAPAPLSTEKCTCRNCGHTFTGNFCPRCGQTRGVYRFRLRHAPGNILRSLFRVDGKFGHTLIALLYRPGHLMRGFMQGRRAAYSMPLQTLFLLVAFYLLAVQLVIPQIKEEKAEKIDTEKAERIRKSLAELQEGRNEETDSLAMAIWDASIALQKSNLAEVLPADSLKSNERLEEEEENVTILGIGLNSSQFGEKLDTYIRDIPFLGRVWELLKRWGHGNRTLHVIAILPLFAVGTYWSFQNRWQLRKHPRRVRFNLMEHFFIQAYIAGQIMLLSILVLPFGLADYEADIFALPWSIIFLLFWWDLRQLYLCSWWASFCRTVWMFVYGFLLFIGIAMFVLLLITIAQSLM
ncbi:MAG TPA: HAD-IA family hydrolase [Candidatus Bacteroides intestinavium]|uniref:phosphoglycolate phosphatase n=1 Tax=Candidatus Bacteroides intestinavium TaxID=2838469 RepID=A0A9D2HTE6_9BACE|nr:HAD-IA family hydrolase [Candidatus Bacteroides intestinavium]